MVLPLTRLINQSGGSWFLPSLPSLSSAVASLHSNLVCEVVSLRLHPPSIRDSEGGREGEIHRLQEGGGREMQVRIVGKCTMAVK